MKEASVGPRRRRHRRVADENRKRAPRACDLCKARKSKCIETSSGVCQRCLRNSLACRYKREISPVEALAGSPSLSKKSQNDTSTMVSTADMTEASPERIFAMGSNPTQNSVWPRFLSRLRDAFSLESQTVSEGERMMMQAQGARIPMLQPAELQRLRKAVDSFPPRSVADFLLSVCIDHGTDSFFYFDQGQLLADIDEFYTDPTSPLRTDGTFLCLAHAALALGSQWTTLAKPEHSSTSLALEDGDPGRIFFNEARTLIPDILDRPSVRCVQAAFVMGVYLLPSSAIGSSYMYMGLALRKALALDMHQDPDDPLLDEKEKEIRRRAWWSLYALERSVTVKLNRPRSVCGEIITVSLPSPYPPLDDKQKFDNVQHQIADAKLVKILDKLGGPSDDDSTVSRCEAELKEWKRSLPASFRLETLEPKDSSYRAVFHLYLNYYFAWIAMGKVSVVTVVRAHLRHRFGRESQPPQIGQNVDNLAKSCVKAAKKMLQLFEDIKRTGNLTRFSFTDFQGCSTATIIVLLAGILDRDSGYEARVKLGLDCLRRMADGNATAKLGVSFVEALQSISDEAVKKLQNTGPQLDTPLEPQATQLSEYNSWLEWLSKANSSQGVLASPAEQSTSDEIFGLQNQSVGSWPVVNHLPDSLSSWDGAAALQQLSAGPTETQASLAAMPECPPQHMDPYLFSTPLPFDDDQVYLMGLTGMDVLNFME